MKDGKLLSRECYDCGTKFCFRKSQTKKVKRKGWSRENSKPQFKRKQYGGVYLFDEEVWYSKHSWDKVEYESTDLVMKCPLCDSTQTIKELSRERTGNKEHCVDSEWSMMMNPPF